jgi:hypothetical protein
VFAEPDGRNVREVEHGLPGNHLVEIAVGPDDTVYALGSCIYSGGLSRFRATDTRATVLVAARSGGNPPLCGERLTTGPAPLVVIARGPALNGRLRQRCGSSTVRPGA